MSSNGPEDLDLDRDLPTTAEDVAALRRLRESRNVSFAEYLEFLSRLKPPAEPRERKTFEGCEPFEF